MATISRERREVCLKLVLAGAPGSGKRTSLRFAHSMLDESLRSPLYEAKTSTDRTLHFDFRPLEPTLIDGYRTCFQVYTVPGEARFSATWELVLRSADGIILVIDSTPELRCENQGALEKLQGIFSRTDLHPEMMTPLILQYNKRDLSRNLTMADLDVAFNTRHIPSYESVAHEGTGVMESLDALSRQVMERFREEVLPHFTHRHSPLKGSATW